MSLNAYAAHFRIMSREEFRYFFSDSLFGGLVCLLHIGVVLLFYSATGLSSFFGLFTWPMLVWYIIVAQLLIANQANVIRVVSNQVQNGEIVTHMTRPHHYPLVLLSQHLASVFVESIAILLFAIPLGIVVAGGGVITGASVASGALCVLLAFVLDFFISLSIGLIAFWTEDARPYRWIFGKLLFIFGGLFFPLDILPKSLQAVAKLLPTAFMVYYPARLVVDFSWPLLLRILIGQAAYIVLFGLLAFFVYRRALRRVSINGG